MHNRLVLLYYARRLTDAAGAPHGATQGTNRHATQDGMGRDEPRGTEERRQGPRHDATSRWLNDQESRNPDPDVTSSSLQCDATQGGHGPTRVAREAMECCGRLCNARSMCRVTRTPDVPRSTMREARRAADAMNVTRNAFPVSSPVPNDESRNVDDVATRRQRPRERDRSRAEGWQVSSHNGKKIGQ